jgi:hypothetical protein
VARAGNTLKATYIQESRVWMVSVIKNSNRKSRRRQSEIFLIHGSSQLAGRVDDR